MHGTWFFPCEAHRLLVVFTCLKRVDAGGKKNKNGEEVHPGSSDVVKAYFYEMN